MSTPKVPSYGSSDPDATEVIAKLTDACEQLSIAYAGLGEQAVAVIGKVRGQYESLHWYRVEELHTWFDVHGPDPHLYSYETSSPPTGLDSFLHGGKVTRLRVHPRHDEIVAALEKALGAGEVTLTNHSLTADELAEFPIQVGNFVAQWLQIRSDFSVLDGLIYDSPDAIQMNLGDPGGLDGWLATSASDRYETFVELQDSSSEGTYDAIAGLVSAALKLLDDVFDHVTKLALLAEQEASDWVDLGQGLLGAILPSKSPEDIFNMIIDGANAFIDMNQGHDERVNEELQLIGEIATDSLGPVNQISQLSESFNTMGGGDGWSRLTSMPTITGDPNAQPSYDQLQYNTAYFHAHEQFWRGISRTLDKLGRFAASIPEIELKLTSLPTFAANVSDSLNDLAEDIISRGLDQGAEATWDAADKLNDTLKDYLAAEAENQALAEDIYQEIYDPSS